MLPFSERLGLLLRLCQEWGSCWGCCWNPRRLRGFPGKSEVNFLITCCHLGVKQGRFTTPSVDIQTISFALTKRQQHHHSDLTRHGIAPALSCPSQQDVRTDQPQIEQQQQRLAPALPIGSLIDRSSSRLASSLAARHSLLTVW